MAILFALGLGWCGVHRFSLGNWQWGLAHIFLFVVSMATFDRFLGWDMTPWLTASAFVAYYDAYRWWRLTDDEFSDRYLERVDEADAPTAPGQAPSRVPKPGRYLAGTAAPHPRVLSAKARRAVLASAKTAYEAYDYQAAAEAYENALDLDLHDGESRVLAARCYTLLEDRDAAYRHLGRAVQLHATNLNLVTDDSDFAWLRTQDDFDARRRIGYRAPRRNGPRRNGPCGNDARGARARRGTAPWAPGTPQPHSLPPGRSREASGPAGARCLGRDRIRPREGATVA